MKKSCIKFINLELNFLELLEEVLQLELIEVNFVVVLQNAAGLWVCAVGMNVFLYLKVEFNQWGSHVFLDGILFFRGCRLVI